MIIRGNVLCVNMERTDFLEVDPAKGSFLVNNPKDDLDNTKILAEAALPKSGGTMTGGISMGGNKVTGLADPTADADAVHKKYVHDYVAGTKATAAVTLTAAGWTENSQNVAAEGVTETNHVLVTPAPESYVAYGESVVYCTGQGNGTLTFRCDEVPETDLTVNILIMN